MNIFKNLLFSTSAVVPQSKDTPSIDDRINNSPYPVYQFHGSVVLQEVEKLRQAGQTPIIMGDVKQFECLLNFLENVVDSNDFDKHINSLISKAESSQTLQWLVDKKAECSSEEWDELFEDRDDTNEILPCHQLTAHIDFSTNEPYDKVFVCVLPCDSWQAFAYLLFGGWNDCPFPEEQVAIFRKWHDKYGAVVTAITNDVVEAQVSNPPTTLDEAMVLAEEYFLYCTDSVYQGHESIPNLAKSLINSRVWFFWWD